MMAKILTSTMTRADQWEAELALTTAQRPDGSLGTLQPLSSCFLVNEPSYRRFLALQGQSHLEVVYGRKGRNRAASYLPCKREGCPDLGACNSGMEPSLQPHCFLLFPIPSPLNKFDFSLARVMLSLLGYTEAGGEQMTSGKAFPESTVSSIPQMPTSLICIHTHH